MIKTVLLQNLRNRGLDVETCGNEVWSLPKNTRNQIKKLWKDFGETPLESLIPDVTLHKTASHRIVLNAKGEIEVVSAMGEIQNLGKEIR